MKRLSTSALLLPALLLLSGCAMLRTSKVQYAGIDKLLALADYPTAIAQIEAAKTTGYTRKDRVVYYLDVGMLYHWNGDHQKSNRALEQAERAMEENFTRSLSRSASALLMNDNLVEYAGEDYEAVYLNAFKALNYLALGQNDSAFVEVRRINNKLSELESKHQKVAQKLSEAEEVQEPFVPAQSRFQESALGRYLSMLLYRQEYKWDDVRIDLNKIERSWKLQPEIHPYPLPDFSPARKRLRPPLARLNIVAFSGRAPDKKADSYYIHTEENLIVLAGTSENDLGRQDLSYLQGLPWPGISAGYHFKIQLPYLQPQPSKVSRIEVVLNGMTPARLQPLESLETAATETFAVSRPMTYLKTATRAVIKGLAAERAKQKMTAQMDGGMALFTRLAADLLIDTTENADLRISRFFPARADIGELHLQEGTYNMAIRYYSAAGKVLYTDERVGVKIAAGQLNVIESSYLN